MGDFLLALRFESINRHHLKQGYLTPDLELDRLDAFRRLEKLIDDRAKQELLSKIEITPIYRIRVDFKLPVIRPETQPGAEDFEHEGAWRDRVDTLSHELHVTGSDAISFNSCEGIDVVGVGPYFIAEYESHADAKEALGKLSVNKFAEVAHGWL